MTGPHENKPMIELLHKRVFCDRHGEPFRKGWPAGYILFAIRSIELLEILDVYARDTIEETIVAAEEALDKKPLCCRHDDESLIKMYQGARDNWATRICKNCKDMAKGNAYTITTPEGQHKTIKHVCFRCVVYRMRPAK